MGAQYFDENGTLTVDNEGFRAFAELFVSGTRTAPR